VVVGDTEMYPTLSDFQSYCTQIQAEEYLDEHQGYTVHVQSGGNDRSATRDPPLAEEAPPQDESDHDLPGVPCQRIEMTVSVPPP
jgi:hypothetical protein